MLLALTAGAQVIDLKAERLSMTPVDATWRFHAGDDPRWAQPGFDDAAWKTLQPGADWVDQGYPREGGIAWFRFQLRVPPNTSSLVLQLPRIEKSFQLFADGTCIGQVGTLPPEAPEAATGAARVFTLPVHAAASARPLTIALRLWQSPRLVGVSPNVLLGPAYAGDPATVLRQFSLGKAASLLSLGSEYTEAIIVLIVGAASLLLFLLTREGSYLWFALNMLFSALDLPVHLLSRHFAWNVLASLNIYILLDLLGSITLVLFILGALNQRARVAVLPLCLCIAAELGPWLLLYSRLPLVYADGIYFLFQTASELLLFWYLVRGWRAQVIDAKLLLLPFSLNGIFQILNNLGRWLIDLNVPHAESILTPDIKLLREPFTVSVGDVGSTVALLGLLAVLVYRFARTSREQQRLASALQAAHDIQHRLVPVEVPSFRGLHANIVYRAAEEVGGDFCQMLCCPDGSILVAIGDVSGKGLQAAMLGTLAVGALRSMAEEAIEPAQLLQRLNQIVLRTAHGGFVTCLCLKLSEEGEVTLANAGHLSPYLNGEEVPVDAGLPLGIVPDVEYWQTHLPLPKTARLTLLSDGVVEARSRAGELFGFERTAAISQRSAAEIADAAHRHGQQDDITIITLDWCQTQVYA